jgi:hypothetical protein
LIVAYTLTGALVFTVVITSLSLVGWIRFADNAQQKKLFSILAVELVLVSVGFFGGLLKFDPQQVERKIPQVEQYKTLSTGLSKFIFATEILQEFLTNNLTDKNAMLSPVMEYNEAITDLRKNEISNLELVQIYPDKRKVAQFDEIMELVKQIDRSVHGLNDEWEKVLVGTQEKIAHDRAKATATESKPLIALLDTKTKEFLTFSE